MSGTLSMGVDTGGGVDVDTHGDRVDRPKRGVGRLRKNDVNIAPQDVNTAPVMRPGMGTRAAPRRSPKFS